MLDKQNRIRLEREYKSIFRKGNKFYSPYFLLVTMRSNPKDPSRFGFIASKKVGNAVARNTIKRRLREIIRLQLPYINPGYDCIVVASPNALEVDYSELQIAMQKPLKKSGLLS